jgi:hypothetical protein
VKGTKAPSNHSFCFIGFDLLMSELSRTRSKKSQEHDGKNDYPFLHISQWRLPPTGGRRSGRQKPSIGFRGRHIYIIIKDVRFPSPITFFWMNLPSHQNTYYFGYYYFSFLCPSEDSFRLSLSHDLVPVSKKKGGQRTHDSTGTHHTMSWKLYMQR